MSLFKGIANEIIIRIMEVTSAGDIVSLASCCKHFSALAQDRLTFHRERRAEAEDVAVGYSWDDTDMIHPSKHLLDIFADDDSRFYVKVMKFGYLKDLDADMEDEERGYRTNVNNQYGPQVTALVTKVYDALLPYVANKVLKKWAKKAKSGDPEAVVYLLLASYPNLETLAIYGPELESWEDHGEWGELIPSLISFAQESRTKNPWIFGKLSIFKLEGGDISEGHEAGLQQAVDFMKLPTVRTIVGSVVDGRRLEWDGGAGTSEVTALDLEGDIDQASISTLIRACKALEFFEYQFHPARIWTASVAREDGLNRLKLGPRAEADATSKDPDEKSKKVWSPHNDFCMEESDRPRWQPGAIIATLLQWAKDSLVSLSLRAKYFEGMVAFSTEDPFIDCLRSFRALKVIYLDTMMLFKKIEPSSNVSSSLARPKQKTLLERIRPHRLVDFLPVTIEDFGMASSLVGKGLAREDVVEMFRGLPHGKHRLPKLLIVRVERNRRDQSEEEEDGELELSERCRRNKIALFRE